MNPDGTPINGGPYFARDENFGSNDSVMANAYWAEFLPADLSGHWAVFSGAATATLWTATL